MATITIKEKALIDEIIKKNKVCHVGIIDTQGFPYVIPMGFGYKDNTIFLHSAQERNKILALENNPNVCIVFCSEPTLKHQNFRNTSS